MPAGAGDGPGAFLALGVIHLAVSVVIHLGLVALGVLAIGFGPALMRRLPRLHWLEAMGSASLPVFCAHLVAVLLVLAFYGNSQTARPWWGDALLLVAVFGGLYAVARATRWVDERRAARQRLRAVAMAPRSTPS